MQNAVIKEVQQKVKDLRNKGLVDGIVSKFENDITNLIDTIPVRSKTVVRDTNFNDADDFYIFAQDLIDRVEREEDISNSEIDEALRHLSSTDFETREIVLRLFTIYSASESIDEEQIIYIINTLLTDKFIFSHILEPDNNAVFKRAYSVLILSEFISRDNLTEFGYIPISLMDIIINKMISYAILENDTRGFIKTNGWAHSFTHVGMIFSNFADSLKILRLDKFIMISTVFAKINTLKSPLIFGEINELVHFLIEVTKIEPAYSDYVLGKIISMGMFDNFNQHPILDESGWNKKYNKKRFIDSIKLKKSYFPKDLKMYIDSKDTGWA